MTLHDTFASLCRTGRARLHVTQRRLAAQVGVSRGYIANIEIGRANPCLALIERIALALDLDIELVVRTPVILGGWQRDLVHARCSGYADRRLRATGWQTAREVEIVSGRSHGWIDLLAFDEATGILLVVEIKTRLDDVGAIERQMAWYERSAFRVARELGWEPRRVVGWLLVLASVEVDDSMRANREVMDRAFPVRAPEMTAMIDTPRDARPGRGIALIDPASRRRNWLIRTRADGRRTKAPYQGYADAVRRFTG
ncbi:MAG TPA: helix-turn-helix transcriptional regulator [Candidatus Limnocylindrales bacterium]|nr:helix-turn-helix transcriptional regulator [Candidatus Limnocylindrales bacterium]